MASTGGIPRALRGPAVLALVVAAGVLVILGAAEGGFAPESWYPAAILMVGLLAALLALAPADPRPPRTVVAAALLLFGFAAWAYLSIGWADDQGAALDGAGRSLMYAVVFALFALWPLRAAAALSLLGLLGFGIATVGLVELVRVSGADDPSGYFIFARFAEPVGYQNANVALWFLGFWPLVAIAARREAHPALAGAALGGATLLTGLALMGQSRGWLFALPVALLLFVALVPDRVRAIAALGIVGVAALVFRGPALAISGSLQEGVALAPLVDDAARAILIAASLAAAAGLAAAFAARSRPVTVDAVRRSDRMALAAGGVGLLVALVAFTIAVGSPASELGDAWDEFKTQSSPMPGEGGSRFSSSLGSDRYDFWRVAWDSFEEQPLRGVGADNFQHDYLERGRGSELPRFPHSLEVAVLSQTGIVGFLLLFGGVGAAAVAGMRAVLGGRELRAAAAAAALGLAGYWLLHASIDWFHEFPALGGIAFAALGIAAGLAPRGGTGREPSDEDAAPHSTDWLTGGVEAAPAADAGPEPSGGYLTGPPPPLLQRIEGRRIPPPPRSSPSRAARPRRSGGPFAGAPVTRAATAVVAAALALALFLPWLSARYTERALDGWPQNPEAALEDLDRAADLNPFSARPLYTAGTVALAAGDLDRSEALLGEAIEREPRNFFATLQLGLVAAFREEPEDAERLLARAVRLAPRDPIARDALAEVRAGRIPDLVEANRRLAGRARERLEAR